MLHSKINQFSAQLFFIFLALVLPFIQQAQTTVPSEVNDFPKTEISISFGGSFAGESFGELFKAQNGLNLELGMNHNFTSNLGLAYQFGTHVRMTNNSLFVQDLGFDGSTFSRDFDYSYSDKGYYITVGPTFGINKSSLSFNANPVIGISKVSDMGFSYREDPSNYNSVIYSLYGEGGITFSYGLNLDATFYLTNRFGLKAHLGYLAAPLEKGIRERVTLNGDVLGEVYTSEKTKNAVTNLSVGLVFNLSK